MSPSVHPGQSDLWLPRSEGAPPYTVHTHYFGFTVPEAGIGAYLYARYMPAFGLSQGGPTIFRGLGNRALLDAEYHDYRATMPWPEVQDGLISFESGYEIEFRVPGKEVALRYRSADGAVWFELVQTAVTPLVARGHIVPGEEDHHGDPDRVSGGSEQFMHCVGELGLHGQTYAVDCFAVRDRSWNQVRTEEPGGARPSPPVGWTPAYFGDDLSFNVTSIESPDSEPAWAGLYDVPPNAPTSYYKWLVVNGELVEIVDVRRSVSSYHPTLHAATRQRLEFTAATGATFAFQGEALSMSPIHSWPNIAFCDSLYRWTDERGRVTHCTYQEIWWDRYQRRMRDGRP
ncbi:MAG TPA: hypothetical protein VMY88_06855 [Acidimicrobiales bacterium]|nr:hypothetical protein [Acidimicrobiales bacterium]